MSYMLKKISIKTSSMYVSVQGIYNSVNYQTSKHYMFLSKHYSENTKNVLIANK